MNNTQKVISLSSIIFLFLIIIFVIIPNRNERNIDIDEQSFQTLSTTTDVIIEESNDFYTIKVKYPREIRDNNNEIEKYIKNTISSIKEEWSLDGELYKNELKLRQDFPDRPIMKYELNIQYERFSSENLNTVSYVFETYTFTGGAHGNTGLQTFTFNKNGLVTIDKILNVNNDLAITKIIENKLRKSLGNSLNEEMLMSGLGLALNDSDENYLFVTNLMNFVVLDDGIRFIFSQYQVAPYSAGQPEVLLTWDELNKFMISN